MPLTAPPVGVNPALDQLLHDIFVTAMEGGIGYWSEAIRYHWTKDGSTHDLAGFYADITDPADEFVPCRIDRDVIYLGIHRIATGLVSLGYLAPKIAAMFMHPEWDHDFDADHADAIVQAGLFNEVVYG